MSCLIPYPVFIKRSAGLSNHQKNSLCPPRQHPDSKPNRVRVGSMNTCNTFSAQQQTECEPNLDQLSSSKMEMEIPPRGEKKDTEEKIKGPRSINKPWCPRQSAHTARFILVVLSNYPPAGDGILVCP